MCPPVQWPCGQRVNPETRSNVDSIKSVGTAHWAGDVWRQTQEICEASETCEINDPNDLRETAEASEASEYYNMSSWAIANESKESQGVFLM